MARRDWPWVSLEDTIPLDDALLGGRNLPTGRRPGDRLLTRPRVRRWKSPTGGLLARLRAWTWYRVLGYCCETCDQCGRPYDDFVWWCPDSGLWTAGYREATGRAPVASEGRGGVTLYSGLLCPRCFTAAIRRIGVRVTWTPRIDEEHTR